MTRIVAGTHRGRPLRVPAGSAVRPTADRAREWLFSSLQSLVDVEGCRFLDLYAGTGALGLEALSRGAAHVDYVELNAPSLRTLGANIAKLGADVETTVRRGAALRFVESLAAGAYDLAFADPPYAHDGAVRVAERWLAVPFARVLGVEHTGRITLPAGGDTRRYGDTAITFYRAGPDGE